MRKLFGPIVCWLWGSLGGIACQQAGAVPAATSGAEASEQQAKPAAPAIILAPLNSKEQVLRQQLESELNALCEFGPRSLKHSWNLHGATDHIARSLEVAGYQVQRQGFEVGEELLQNLEVVLMPLNEQRPTNAAGSPPVEESLSPFAGRALVVAAHYDSAAESLGADAAASGAAALLVLAKALQGMALERPLRLVWLTNESGSTGSRGSEIYVESLSRRQAEVSAALVLGGLGHYSVQANSQTYPEQLLYGATGRSRRGEFLGVVYNARSDALYQQLTFQWEAASLPIQPLILPESAPLANGGPQSTFWKAGWVGLSLTDTEVFRDANYNNTEDTPDRLDMGRYARAVAVVQAVVYKLVGAGKFRE